MEDGGLRFFLICNKIIFVRVVIFSLVCSLFLTLTLKKHMLKIGTFLQTFHFIMSYKFNRMTSFNSWCMMSACIFFLWPCHLPAFLTMAARFKSHPLSEGPLGFM